LDLAIEIAREGREGRRIGTLFTLATPASSTGICSWDRLIVCRDGIGGGRCPRGEAVLPPAESAHTVRAASSENSFYKKQKQNKHSQNQGTRCPSITFQKQSSPVFASTQRSTTVPA